ncbi:UDP-N-acetylmuramoyl-L-alanyl-D-glutamate--2,6-diaminopimelate ligase [Patescibacteria group bacterium]|nr:UDP-N-acetylmuramoyl-L-alanyl-D-glutamate--2,6-diaminopimelate ligase [Patescibacteria group bacterium]
MIKKFIPKFIFNVYHYKLALISAFWHRFPSKKIKVIGITGTKGKSTTAILAGNILEEAGFKVAWLTSATIKVGDKEILNPEHMTMPGRFKIQGFLRKAVRAKCDYAILEVTSEGIKQYRHKFITFDTAVFTNLQPEHIEAHGSFENYRNEKLKLFKATKKNHILNLDDKNVDYFLRFKAEKKLGFSTKNQKPEAIFAKDLEESRDGVSFSIDSIRFNLKLLGRFNIYNALSAICIGLIYGVNLETCKRALEKIKTIQGRMEVIIEKPFKVIVDLAHTPDSFEEVFKAVKDFPHNKIIAIFGSAGGGRDKWKRPVLGKIAAENSDIIILCNEDPYNEKPEEIISEIKSGVIGEGFQKTNLYEIPNRREAIKKGLELTEENDIVLVLGKGTEQLLVIGSKKIPWDDREVVREEHRRISH